MKKRRECFYGLHSDFHAVPAKGIVIGATLREADIRELCETLRPDFIQIDCKGHPGNTSYPSKLGNAMPEFACDPLKIWRRVTREYGVSLYMHYSGVYDKRYCEEHPEARVLRADGTYSDFVRFDSRYADELMIPQIAELYEDYGIDGVWIDGDCWASQADYHDETISLFEKQTGIDLGGNPPKARGDAYFDEYLDFTRERFREFLRHYVDTLHAKFPKLEICSNWAFSDHMNEAVCADVDFLSGDLNPANCVNSARYAGRMIASQNMPWDLMSWHFRYMYYGDPMTPPKHVTQIMQEAAAVIALGGAFQDNIQQFPDGSPNIEQIRNIKPLADFMHERKDFCFGGRFIHQAAVLVSGYDTKATMTKPFARERSNDFIGMTALLCDSGVSFEMMGEYNLTGRMSDYPVIIVPELAAGLAEDTVKELREYAENGGGLVLVGMNTAKIFSEAGFGFDVSDYREYPELANWTGFNVGHMSGTSTGNTPSYLRVKGGDCGQLSKTAVIEAEGGEVLATAHRSLRGDGVPVAAVMPFGKGRLAVVGFDLAKHYTEGAQYQPRELVKAISEALYEPFARIERSLGLLELVCLTKDGKTLLQLVNGNGAHSDAAMLTSDFIPPVLDVTVSVKADTLPGKVILQPEGRELEFSCRDGRVYFDIPRIDIHSVIEII